MQRQESQSKRESEMRIDDQEQMESPVPIHQDIVEDQAKIKTDGKERETIDRNLRIDDYSDPYNSNQLPQIGRVANMDLRAAREIIRLEKRQEAGLPLSPHSEKGGVILSVESGNYDSSVKPSDGIELDSSKGQDRPQSIAALSKIDQRANSAASEQAEKLEIINELQGNPKLSQDTAKNNSNEVAQEAPKD